jgi:chaperonin GroEL
MIVKQLNFGEDAREKLKSGIKKMAQAVKSTLGARGKFVAIESENHIGGLTVTKDGVTVANSINLYDPDEDLAVRMVRQAAQKTASVAGDGTTTSIVLAESIINEAEKWELEESNMTEITRHIDRMAKDVVKSLSKKAKKLTGRRLYDVAAISANNDKDLGKLIGDAYKHVGNNGIVTVADSKTSNTYIETIKGIRIDRGYTSKTYVTDQKRGECVLEKPLVFVTDQEVPSVKHIENIISYAIKAGRPLLIIGEMNIAASSTIEYNVFHKKIKACNIIPPSFGYRREEMLKDICTVSGAKFLSEKLGNDWNNIHADVLGTVDKAVISESRTILINDSMNEATIDLLSDLEDKIRTAEIQEKKEVLMERLSCVSGKAAVIYVGGKSDIEIKEKKDRVDDSVFATRAAIEEGILPGGGIALLNASWDITVDSGDQNEVTAAQILGSAMASPFKQIVENAGKNSDDILDSIEETEEYGYGYDVKDEKYGNMYKMGVIDPAKVTKSALMNAVSVATTILMCDTVVTNMRSDESVK